MAVSQEGSNQICVNSPDAAIKSSIRAAHMKIDVKGH